MTIFAVAENILLLETIKKTRSNRLTQVHWDRRLYGRLESCRVRAEHLFSEIFGRQVGYFVTARLLDFSNRWRANEDHKLQLPVPLKDYCHREWAVREESVILIKCAENEIIKVSFFIKIIFCIDYIFSYLCKPYIKYGYWNLLSRIFIKQCSCNFAVCLFAEHCYYINSLKQNYRSTVTP